MDTQEKEIEDKKELELTNKNILEFSDEIFLLEKELKILKERLNLELMYRADILKK